MKAKETNNLNVTDFCIQKCKIRKYCINCILYTKSCYIKNVSTKSIDSNRIRKLEVRFLKYSNYYNIITILLQYYYNIKFLATFTPQ